MTYVFSEEHFSTKLNMVGHFKERIAGAFEHIEPWFIASVAFNPKKHQVDIHIGVRKATDIVCPYCRRVIPYHIYEPHRNLIASVENTHSNNVISRFDYTNDPIGNRTSSTEWDESGVARTSHYTANELNEYESRTIPGHITILGEASTNATVTVNGNPTWRKGSYFIGGDNFDNHSSSVFAELATTAVRSTTDSDEVESSIGHKFLAQTPETFTYDADGNMTSDGRFNYTWDAENRLIAAETRTDLVPDVLRIRGENAYDHQFRRIGKCVWTNSVVQYHSTFAYEKWKMVKESRFNNDSLATSSFVWGLDLSGTLHKAGGVGGLLLCLVNGKTLSSAFDGNGNVDSCIAPSGQVIGRYEYSPSGLPLAFEQQFATPFLFSSKYYDAEVGIYYYGYRYHNPRTGRWLSRDPIGERGGLQLFLHCQNTSISTIDSLGRELFSGEPFAIFMVRFNGLSDLPGNIYYEFLNDAGFVVSEVSELSGDLFEWASDRVTDSYRWTKRNAVAAYDYLSEAVPDALYFAWQLPTEIIEDTFSTINYLFGADVYKIDVCFESAGTRTITLMFGGLAFDGAGLTLSDDTIWFGRNLESALLSLSPDQLNSPGYNFRSLVGLMHHEPGHMVQAKYLGPLYLPVIGLFTIFDGVPYLGWGEHWADENGRGIHFPEPISEPIPPPTPVEQ